MIGIGMMAGGIGCTMWDRRASTKRRNDNDLNCSIRADEM